MYVHGKVPESQKGVNNVTRIEYLTPRHLVRQYSWDPSNDAQLSPKDISRDYIMY